MRGTSRGASVGIKLLVKFYVNGLSVTLINCWFEKLQERRNYIQSSIMRFCTHTKLRLDSLLECLCDFQPQSLRLLFVVDDFSCFVLCFSCVWIGCVLGVCYDIVSVLCISGYVDRRKVHCRSGGDRHTFSSGVPDLDRGGVCCFLFETPYHCNDQCMCCCSIESPFEEYRYYDGLYLVSVRGFFGNPYLD